MFFGHFHSEHDVFNEFEPTAKEQRGVEFVWACYEIEGYEGSAWAVFRQHGKLWLVEGSHCSCYGLEGQWSPEEVSPALLKLKHFYGCDHRGELLAALVPPLPELSLAEILLDNEHSDWLHVL